jgi:pimeloyl-ACP methyl ester carboxylesterase
VLAHSYGAFYALALAQQAPNVKALLLLDPTGCTPSYHQTLVTGNVALAAHKLEQWESYPRPLPLAPRVVVRVHLALTEQLAERVQYFTPLCKANVQSALEVHMASHMLHYDLPQLVIVRVLALLKEL